MTALSSSSRPHRSAMRGSSLQRTDWAACRISWTAISSTSNVRCRSRPHMSVGCSLRSRRGNCGNCWNVSRKDTAPSEAASPPHHRLVTRPIAIYKREADPNDADDTAIRRPRGIGASTTIRTSALARFQRAPYVPPGGRPPPALQRPNGPWGDGRSCSRLVTREGCR